MKILASMLVSYSCWSRCFVSQLTIHEQSSPNCTHR